MFSWLGERFIEVICWAIEEFRYERGGNWAIFRLFGALIVLGSLLIPLLIMGLFYRLWLAIKG